jgi:hypothetical protein
VSTNRVDNTKNPDKFLQYKSPHFLPFLFLVPRNISHPPTNNDDDGSGHYRFPEVIPSGNS